MNDACLQRPKNRRGLYLVKSKVRRWGDVSARQRTVDRISIVVIIVCILALVREFI